MRHLSFLIVAPALALAVCSSAAQTVAPVAAGSAELAGQQVFKSSCVACHGGADEKAPELATLHCLDRDRILNSLSKDGLVALQSGTPTAEQRANVIAFLTAPVELNDNWEVIRSEMLLLELHQRIRDIEQSPDGYLY